MKPWSRFPRRFFAVTIVASCVVLLTLVPSGLTLGQPTAQDKLKTAPTTAAPAAGKMPTDLLKAQPFDRITLTDNSTWLIEPVSPRPLLEYDAAKFKAAQKAAKKAAAAKPAINPQGNVGVGEDKKKDENKNAKQAAAAPADLAGPTMDIHLMEGEIRDFRIDRASLKKIEYFEDLLMAEADRLIVARDFAKAFEHYLLVQSRDPKWKGLEDRVKKLLYAEGAWALVEQDRDRGVRLLRELSGRQNDFPGLGETLAKAYEGRIRESFEKGLYPYGRRILHDLEQIAPDSLVVKTSRELFEKKAKTLMDEGAKVEGTARLEKYTDALRVWPKLEGAAEKYSEIFKTAPTLDVAVVDLPRPAGPFIRSPAGERVSRLLYLPLLANETDDAAAGKLSNQLLSGIEIGDIGLKVDLKVKPGVMWSDGSRQVGAMDVVRALSDRAQPRSPGYSARWADMLDRIEITDEQQVTVRLNRSISMPRAWFLIPVGPGHAAWDGRVPSPDGKRRPVGDGPFNSESESDTSASYVAASKEIAPGAVRRIREVRFNSGAAALGALVRGEVSLVERVPPDRVGALSSEPDLKLGAYSRPMLHRLALDGRNPALKNRSLRRGMAIALDRKGILEELVIRRSVDAANAPSDGPMAFESYANSPNVTPYKQDLLLAKMLVNAAKTEMKMGAIKLKLEYPAIPEAQASVPKIVESLRAIGLDVTAQERSESELEDALRAGRKFDIAYRASRCVEPVWEIGPLLCPGFDAPLETDGLSAISSPRIMQLLLELEHAQDWNSAKDLVTQIDRECRDELPVIPLWQIQDYYAYRNRLKGPAESADHLYQGIDQWQIEPWFAKDPW